jgi:hypothetical protein
MDDSKRKARAEALASMYKETTSMTRHQRTSQSSSLNGKPMPSEDSGLSDPSELIDQDKWSKTKITDNIQGWSATHKRELDYMASWIKSLWEE